MNREQIKTLALLVDQLNYTERLMFESMVTSLIDPFNEDDLDKLVDDFVLWCLVTERTVVSGDFAILCKPSSVFTSWVLTSPKLHWVKRHKREILDKCNKGGLKTRFRSGGKAVRGIRIA